ncbi:fructose-6-phosphate aldolase [Pararhodospirillum oryzae]|uniref:Probable transaldolase n=1 Tax=Pararhodospirillum oryzae TaxID=478448 RepID=A0A512H9W0_9PROT|nr:fructose-6-phosphate aldolase [Pararhodospirillum oryzae]GEO82237.1 putative transaldolase [Pararhodospirillum oryzae]
MKFFIDTANLTDIKELAATGMVDGVTTNPTLAAREGKDFLSLIADICAVVPGPVSAEVTALDTDGMLAEGRRLARIAPNIAVKLPLTRDGLRACRALSDEGIMVNVTLCFSAGQALLAAKAGARFVSPFVGRLDDLSQDGMGLIGEILAIYGNYPALRTEVLVASVRHPMHVVQAARMGADVATVPPKVLYQLFEHPLTDRGLKAFLDDWAKSGQTIL